MDRQRRGRSITNILRCLLVCPSHLNGMGFQTRNEIALQYRLFDNGDLRHGATLENIFRYGCSNVHRPLVRRHIVDHTELGFLVKDVGVHGVIACSSIVVNHIVEANVERAKYFARVECLAKLEPGEFLI
jgi:hypothetical protein